jgi:hypothetical protein
MASGRMCFLLCTHCFVACLCPIGVIQVQQREKESKSVVTALEDQDRRIQDCERQLDEKKHEYRQWSELPDGTSSLQEMDMEYKQLNSRIRTILKLLTALISQHPSLGEPVQDVMETVGLQLNGQPIVKPGRGGPKGPKPPNGGGGGVGVGARSVPSSVQKPPKGPGNGGNGPQGVTLPPVTPSRGVRISTNSPKGIARTPGTKMAGPPGAQRRGSNGGVGSKPNSRPGSSRGMPPPAPGSGRPGGIRANPLSLQL